jgi:RNA polymerase sigma factor (sigma-70 family)
MSQVVIDHSQITLLFRQHREDILSFIRHKIQCPDTAQDLCQEAYLRLLKQDALTHTDNLTGYLFRTAERLTIDFLRYEQRIKSRAMDLDDSFVCPKIQPEALTIFRQQCELLLDAIAALPCQTRHVFLLRKIDDMSYADIGSQLGISEKTVQRHLVKAMLHCHRRLGMELAMV